jgi:hypothetical protein
MRWIDPNGHYSFSNLNRENANQNYFFSETQVMIYIHMHKP